MGQAKEKLPRIRKMLKKVTQAILTHSDHLSRIWPAARNTRNSSFLFFFFFFFWHRIESVQVNDNNVIEQIPLKRFEQKYFLITLLPPNNLPSRTNADPDNAQTRDKNNREEIYRRCRWRRIYWKMEWNLPFAPRLTHMPVIRTWQTCLHPQYAHIFVKYKIFRQFRL